MDNIKKMRDLVGLWSVIHADYPSHYWKMAEGREKRFCEGGGKRVCEFIFMQTQTKPKQETLVKRGRKNTATQLRKRPITTQSSAARLLLITDSLLPSTDSIQFNSFPFKRSQSVNYRKYRSTGHHPGIIKLSDGRGDHKFIHVKLLAYAAWWTGMFDN